MTIQKSHLHNQRENFWYVFLRIKKEVLQRLIQLFLTRGNQEEEIIERMLTPNAFKPTTMNQLIFFTIDNATSPKNFQS